MTEAHISGEFIISQDIAIRDVGQTKVANISGLVVETVGTGESKKDTFNYFDLELWDRAAEYVYNNAKKGDSIIVLSGRPRQNRWEKDDIKHSKVIFRVSSFRIIPKVNKEPE